jgi:hypothetical protein
MYGFLMLACMLVVSEQRVVKYPKLKGHVPPKAEAETKSSRKSGKDDNRTSRRGRRSAVGPIWPEKIIPYAFSNIIEFDFDARIKVREALREIEQSLAINGEDCIMFVERKNEPNYIVFVNKGDCSSGIGYENGPNKISLAETCLDKGTIIHEVMHRYILSNKINIL